MLSRRDALKAAIMQRKCPPPSMQNSPDWQKEYSAHCSICPFCQEGEDTGNYSLNQDFAQLFNTFPLHFKQIGPEGAPRIKSGDIRLLKRRKNPWSQGFYFNPPVVAILADEPDSDGCLPVAQTFFDPALAGPGDLATGSLFIETWNLYNVISSSIGSLLDRVERSIIKEVKAMYVSRNYCPEWAPVFTFMEKDDPRLMFRKMEKETALFFNDNPISPPVFHFMDKNDLVTSLKKTVKGIKWEFQPENIWDILINARFPEEYYPKAAADSDFFHYYAKLYVYEKGKIKEILVVRAEAECVKGDTGVTCSIFFPELPYSSEEIWAYSYLKINSHEIVAPKTITTSVKEKSVIVEFEADCCDTAGLQTALFCCI